MAEYRDNSPVVAGSTLSRTLYQQVPQALSDLCRKVDGQVKPALGSQPSTALSANWLPVD